MRISDSTRNRLTAWWEQRAYDDRPCILATLPAGEEVPVAPYTTDEFWTDPAKMAQVRAAWMRSRVCLGEAVPYLYMDYGANAVALQMGAKENWRSIETIWVDPVCETAEEVCALTRRGRWREIEESAIVQGLKQCGEDAMLSTYCLGGAADLVAAMLGTENTLLGLLDEPDAMKRAMRHMTDVIIEHFTALQAQCKAANVPMNGWHGIWAPDTTTPLQEDFSYMIGNAMFEEFCLPFIRDIADVVPFAFYHLDGIGALKHLPSVLKVEKLRVIQWQPGEGHMAMKNWVDVLRTILASGKSCQVYANCDDIRMLTREIGAKGMLYIVTDTPENTARLADEYRL